MFKRVKKYNFTEISVDPDLTALPFIEKKKSGWSSTI